MGINIDGGSKAAIKYRREMGRIRAVDHSPIAVRESEEHNFWWLVSDKSDGSTYGTCKYQMNAIRKAERLLVARGYVHSTPYVNFEWVKK